jgi:hypothetical protein
MGRRSQRSGWLGVAIAGSVLTLAGCTSQATPPTTPATTTVPASTADTTSASVTSSSDSEPSSSAPSTTLSETEVSTSVPPSSSSDAYPLPTDSTTVPAGKSL